jgi:hypothetical protein
MRGKAAFLWISQIVLPGAIVLYVLCKSAFGSPVSDWMRLAANGALVWIVVTAGVLVASRAKRPLLLRVGVSLWAIAMIFSVLLCLVKVAGVRSDIPLTLWRVKHTLAGKHDGIEAIGIYAAHPRYGWSHVPGAVGKHEFVDFDVVYTIDSDGFRVTDSPPKATKEVLCLGCSVTFGHGVSDSEAYPAILGRQYWTDIKVRNGAVNAWGTAQAYLFAEDYLASHKAPALVLYSWGPYHLERNYRRKRWLEILSQSGRKNPYFEIEGDRLCYRGLAGSEDGLPSSPALRATEADVSAHLLTGIGQLCREHGSRFVVLLLPTRFPNPVEDALTNEIAGEVRRKGLECFDLGKCTQGQSRERLYFAHDPHPQAPWHELIAQAIAETLPLARNRHD